jgi:hypothetical protein
MTAELRLFLIGVLKRTGQEGKCFIDKGMECAPRGCLFLTDDPFKDFSGVRRYVSGEIHQPSVALAQSVVVQKRLREEFGQLILRNPIQCPHLHFPIPKVRPLLKREAGRFHKSPWAGRLFGYSVASLEAGWHLVRGTGDLPLLTARNSPGFPNTFDLS